MSQRIFIESLDWQVGSEDDVELKDLIPDKPLDIDLQLSFKPLIKACPERLLDIVEKKFECKVLSQQDISYLWKWQKKLRQLFPELAEARKPRLGRPAAAKGRGRSG